MRVLFDFGAIKEGGGVQLSLNFLEGLPKFIPKDWQADLLLPEKGPLAEVRIPLKASETFRLPSHPLKRMIFEHGALQRALRSRSIETIYTFFGAGLPHPRGIKSVVSMAYPIICYPESPYWLHVDKVVGYKKRFVNQMRRMRLAQADRVIVETEVMRNRVSRAVGFPRERIRVLKPAVSHFVKARPFHSGSAFNVLCLSGLASHKNLWRLYAVARILREQKAGSIRFLLSVDRNRWISTLREKTIDQSLIDGSFVFCGPVHPSKINELYQQANALMSLSDLESFSNNYMEAWKAEVPLIVSDRDFARHICGDSALYVEPHDGMDVATKVRQLASDENLQRQLIANGKPLLAGLPTLEGRYREILDSLDS